ncbi:predicted protein, partial [Phaeodactylum tricornutum CCAP 1055/1]
LSFITEQVAEHTNGTIGALLNATFGNAPELLISVAALRAGFYRVVQLAMLGSMLTNMLLVFGVSCWIGGCRYQVQELRTTSGSVSVTMLLVATAGSLFPAALRLSGQMPTDNIHANVPTMEEVTFCRVNAVVMLILYVAYLVFQLGTHKEDNDESHAHVHSFSEHDVHSGGPLISMRVGVIWLFVITLCISAMSDILIETIDSFSQRMHLSQVFTSMVIIPFFSNVAEQVSAFLFAYRNEMDLCVGVTVGSAVQIATFVLPGSVLIGAVMDRSMTLYFHGYETTCLFFGTIVTVAVLQGGTSNWLTGAMMVGIYVMMATGVYFH